MIEPTARVGLLTGSHSLWYALVMFELHAAFTDLDRALDEVPAPVRLAVTQERQAEARDLRAELLEYNENIEPATPVQRSWEHSFPFVAYDGRHDAWATTPVGEPLAGTGFIVTSRDDQPE